MIRHRLGVPLCAGLLAGAALCVPATCPAQGADRERAQMLQMQQQLQRVQSDNAALQRERSTLQEQAKEADALKKETAQKAKDLARSQAAAAAASRQLADLQAQLDAQRVATDAQVAQWKKALEERDAALQVAAVEKRKMDAEITLLSGRLKMQTGRADLCETKHAQAMEFGKRIVDRIEGGRLRACEPITGIWRVREEQNIQALRDQLYELRLDVPPETPAKPVSSVAAPMAGTAAAGPPPAGQ